jgi:hypothetical protein
MKKVWIALCLALFVFWALPAGSFALSVGSPYKSGSLLIFPLIDVSGDMDTVIEITNGIYLGVNVTCRYRSVSDDTAGFTIFLEPNETGWFSMKTGEGSISGGMAVGEKGELKCWAVDPSGSEQISWNYLDGFAEITDLGPDGLTWGYSSWNFAADQPRGVSVGVPGTIELSGKPGEYDAMPKYLSFSLPKTLTQANLTLIVGKQDLRQDRDNNYSKAKFNYSKGNTSGTQCIENWVQTSIPRAVLGSFKVQGIASTVCDKLYKKPSGTTQNAPILGVIEAHRNKAVYGIMPIGIGFDQTGYILWDTDGAVPEAISR